MRTLTARTLSFVSMLVASVSFLAPPASSLVIDDFNSGDFSVSDTVAGDGFSLTGQTISGVLGDARETGLNLKSGTGSVTAAVSGGALTWSTVSGVGEAQSIYDGENNSTLSFNPGNLLGVDLTLDGADRFRFDVLAVTGSVQVRVLASAIGSNTLFGVGLVPISSAGTYDILFGAFDLTNVDALMFDTSGDLVSAGESITFGSFATVPEPSTGLLIATGLIGLAVRRRG